LRDVSPDILYMARKKVLQNAQSLYEDAKILFENNRWPRSFFLSQIATEELGKYGLIVTSSVWAAHGSLDWNHFRKRFTNHKDKTKHFLLFEGLYHGNLSDDFFENFDENEDADTKLADSLEKIKMASLYCDMNKDGMVSLPGNVITKDFCEISLDLLRNRLTLVSNYEKEIASKIDQDRLNKVDMEYLDKILEEIAFKKSKK
jgi:AbiV family abortive infection protein